MNKEKENIIKKSGVCEDYLVICDHASNNIPLEYKNLGVSKKDLQSHRAFDLGASEVASELSNLLNCNNIYFQNSEVQMQYLHSKLIEYLKNLLKKFHNIDR